jgi:CBS domain-containing protein
MTSDVFTVSPDLSLAELERLLASRGVSGAPVVETCQLIGVVSRADVVRVLGKEEGVAELVVSFYQSPWDDPVSPVEAMVQASEAFGEKLRHLTVRDAMSPHVIFVSPETPLEDAARLMSERRVHRVLVWDGDTLCGIVTSLDVVDAVAQHGLGS